MLLISISSGFEIPPTSDASEPLPPYPSSLPEQPPGFTPSASTPLYRLPNRQLPPRVPAAPYIIVNVSWQFPLNIDDVPGFPIHTPTPARAEVDTALTFSSGLPLAFGPGCNATYSNPLSSILFSGDDIYAPGWEAYQITLPPITNNSSNNSSVLPLDDFLVGNTNINIFVSRGLMFQFNPYDVTVTMYSADGTVVSHTSLTLSVATQITGTCATDRNRAGPVASLRMHPDTGMPMVTGNILDFKYFTYVNPKYSFTPFSLSSEEPEESHMPDDFIYATQIPSDFIVVPAQTFPPVIIGTGLLLNTSWSTSDFDLRNNSERQYWDIETGILLPDRCNDIASFRTEYRDSWCIRSDIPNGIYASVNNVEATGSESWLIDLDLLFESLQSSSSHSPENSGALDDDNALKTGGSTEATIVTFADWFYNENRNGDAVISAHLLHSGTGRPLKGQGTKASIEEIVPGVSKSCEPTRPVAAVTVHRESTSNNEGYRYRIVSFTTDDLPSEVTPEPYCI